LKKRYRVGTLGAGLVAAAFLAAGCGTGGVASAGERPDTQAGQQLFTTDCGTCHTLSAAGTTGTIGPNLDNAFAASVAEGYPQSTVENVVLDQIRLGSGPIATYTTVKNGKGLTPQTQMPANIVKGQDAIDVAAYVASVAGQGGYTTSGGFASLGTNGAAIFKGAGCAGCHTLAAAGATGTVGPNLDQVTPKPTMAIVVRQVTNGGAVMPAFKGRLSAAQIQAVAKYVSSSAGK
jgi:cbb3-type cytochrome c oxidase subunit III